MILIQMLVVITALMILYFVLSRVNSHSSRAWKKIMLIFLALAMVVAVLFPEITNQIANFMGVGRGADLLLYTLTLGFIIYVLNSYIKRQDDQDKLFRLARKVALLEADEKYNLESLNSKIKKKS
jgi:hypothetical protein